MKAYTTLKSHGRTPGIRDSASTAMNSAGNSRCNFSFTADKIKSVRRADKFFTFTLRRRRGNETLTFSTETLQNDDVVRNQSEIPHVISYIISVGDEVTRL